MSAKDLIPYVPGQTGNPLGRPKGLKDGIGAHCRRMLKKDFTMVEIIRKLKDKGFDLSDGSTSEAISAVLIAKALTGDLTAIQMLEKYELDLPSHDPSVAPNVSITLVQAKTSENAGSVARKTITINGREIPVNIQEPSE
jgi:hypothetical protein